MNFVRFNEGRFALHFSRREKQVFLEALKLYPLTPASFHQLSRSADRESIAADQQMLLEAMEEFRSRTKGELEKFLLNKQVWKAVPDGSELNVTREELDWLLRILNDIRVGSWERLGRPDPGKGIPPALSPKNLKYQWAMEFSAAFQMFFLQILNQDLGKDSGKS